MKALVTGATGFIGSHLAEELLRRGYRVRCLVRRPRGLGWIERLGLEFVLGDCRDERSLYDAVEGVDYVFHLAAVIHSLSWDEYFQANVLGTGNLLNACADRNPGLKKFILVSSISAAGPSERGKPRREKDPCRPISAYGRSKKMAEEAVSCQARGFPWVIVRPPNVLGPRQKELEEAIKLVKRRIEPLAGTREPRTSLCYVGDVVDALILCAEEPKADGEIFFISDSPPYAWSEITRAIQEELGNRRALVKVPYAAQILAAALAETYARWTRKRPRLTRESVAATRKHFWVYDGSKISRTLGFQPQTGLKEAIRETIAWYREQRLI